MVEQFSVETPGQVLMLQRLGCQRGQGYHFARPAPADRITALLESDSVVVPAA